MSMRSLLQHLTTLHAFTEPECAAQGGGWWQQTGAVRSRRAGPLAAVSLNVRQAQDSRAAGMQAGWGMNTAGEAAGTTANPQHPPLLLWIWLLVTYCLFLGSISCLTMQLGDKSVHILQAVTVPKQWGDPGVALFSVATGSLLLCQVCPGLSHTSVLFL
jgi:hypothetical protein